MISRPTLIVTATPSALKQATAGSSGLLAAFDAVELTVSKLLRTRLPLKLVCDEGNGAAARQVLPRSDVIIVPFKNQTNADQQVEALAAGIMATANASGWLLLPGTGSMPKLEPSAILAVEDALAHCGFPLVHASYRQQRGTPLGFSSELYSELIQMVGSKDLDRLYARYPAHGVELDAPAILTRTLQGLQGQINGVAMCAPIADAYSSKTVRNEPYRF